MLSLGAQGYRLVWGGPEELDSLRLPNSRALQGIAFPPTTATIGRVHVLTQRWNLERPMCEAAI